MSLKKMTRIDKISQLLIAKTGVSIRELAVELGVSEITIRRDLKQLEQQGTVKLINGVAIHRAAPTVPFPSTIWITRFSTLETGRPASAKKPPPSLNPTMSLPLIPAQPAPTSHKICPAAST